MDDLDLKLSVEAMARAVKAIPGGVNSPVRALRGVGGDPFFAAGGEGAYIFDLLIQVIVNKLEAILTAFVWADINRVTVSCIL